MTDIMYLITIMYRFEVKKGLEQKNKGDSAATRDMMIETNT